MPPENGLIRAIDYAALAQEFKEARPFSHVVIDDFFAPDAAENLLREFPAYDEDSWYTYDNAIEHKKTLNDWHKFPPHTYTAFSQLNSSQFLHNLRELTGVELHPDSGLHGGGWHIHGTGGNLNPHLDYSLHPKLKLQRKLNIIIYMSPELLPEHGGHLGLWDHDPELNQPAGLAAEIAPLFNRAVIFDTTQNSWHGMSRKLRVPSGVFRRSLAAYFLTVAAEGVDSRERALFAPRDEQKGDARVAELIKIRADPMRFSQAYRKQD